MLILIPVSDKPHSLAAVDFVASRKALVGRDPQVALVHAQWPIPRKMIRVVGHGRGAFTSAVLGSVATRVAASCRTPLLPIQRA